MEEVDYEDEDETNSHQRVVSSSSNNNNNNTQTCKGRSNKEQDKNELNRRNGNYETFHSSSRHDPVKSVEGYILMISNIHCEAQEEDILDKFSEFGDVRNIDLTLDKCTGYVKGYALIQYEKLEQAKEAIREMNQSQLLGQIINVGFAFKQK